MDVWNCTDAPAPFTMDFASPLEAGLKQRHHACVTVPNVFSGQRHTLVFDGDCEMCKRFVALLRRWDTREAVETIPSQDTSVRARFPWIPAAAYDEAMQLIGPNGSTWPGSAAVEELLRILPRGWLIGWMFKLPYGRTIADRLYRRVARSRKCNI